MNFYVKIKVLISILYIYSTIDGKDLVENAGAFGVGLIARR